MGPGARRPDCEGRSAVCVCDIPQTILYTSTGSAHMLTRGDVLPTPYGLAVHVASTKTMLGDHPVVIPVHRITNCSYCPVAAYMAARVATHAPLTAPLFLTSTGQPLTPHGLAALMRTALNLAGRHPGGGEGNSP